MGQRKRGGGMASVMSGTPYWASFGRGGSGPALEDEIDRLAAGGREVHPVVAHGDYIAKSVWGRAWCDNLIALDSAGVEADIGRGGEIVLAGHVVDLTVGRGYVRAMIFDQGIRDVEVRMKTMSRDAVQLLTARCAGEVTDTEALLNGAFSKSVFDGLVTHEAGLMPPPGLMQARCDCNAAGFCRHAAAAMWAVGTRIDAEPKALFRLRGARAETLVGAPEPAVESVEAGAAAAVELANPIAVVNVETTVTQVRTAVRRVAPRATPAPVMAAMIEPKPDPALRAPRRVTATAKATPSWAKIATAKAPKPVRVPRAPKPPRAAKAPRRTKPMQSTLSQASYSPGQPVGKIQSNRDAARAFVLTTLLARPDEEFQIVGLHAEQPNTYKIADIQTALLWLKEQERVVYMEEPDGAEWWAIAANRG
jgi:uncharacterized Zn finger protein